MAKTEAILLGAIGDPRVEVGYLERAIIWGVRQRFDLYVNLRPIKLYAERLCPLKDKTPEDVDMVVVRENTEDAYAGLGGIHRKGTPHEVAIAEMIYTRNGVERVIRYAFELAEKRNKGGAPKVTLVDKANAIRAQDIWTRTFAEVASEYPGVETDHAYIDAACMWMVKNPEWFDVVVTPNLFGDIITDLGAMVQGGMGIAASGNIHPGQVVHVRADPRLGAQVPRQEHREPHRHDRGDAHAARPHRGVGGGRPHRRRRSHLAGVGTDPLPVRRRARHGRGGRHRPGASCRRRPRPDPVPEGRPCSFPSATRRTSPRSGRG